MMKQTWIKSIRYQLKQIYPKKVSQCKYSSKKVLQLHKFCPSKENETKSKSEKAL